MFIGEMEDDMIRPGLDALHRRLAEDPCAAMLLGFIEQATREPYRIDRGGIGGVERAGSVRAVAR